MNVIVYADFGCPECYLAARRCDLLAAAGAEVDFRAVETHPELPVHGRRLSPEDQDGLSDRFRRLKGMLLPGEQLPWTMPASIPRTEAAVAAYAAIADTPVAADVRRLLFELYWREGADIGSPNVLRTPLAGPALRSNATADAIRQTGYLVSVDRAPLTEDADRRVRAWRSQWRALDNPALPALLTEGATLHGIDALRRLGKLITSAGADVEPALADPRRYPAEPVTPSPYWASWIGGRWRNSYRRGATARS